jgi:hypothetical protein
MCSDIMAACGNHAKTYTLCGQPQWLLGFAAFVTAMIVLWVSAPCSDKMFSHFGAFADSIFRVSDAEAV